MPHWLKSMQQFHQHWLDTHTHTHTKLPNIALSTGLRCHSETIWSPTTQPLLQARLTVYLTCLSSYDYGMHTQKRLFNGLISSLFTQAWFSYISHRLHRVNKLQCFSAKGARGCMATNKSSVISLSIMWSVGKTALQKKTTRPLFFLFFFHTNHVQIYT